MSKPAIWAQLKAKPGKEKEVEEFLKWAQPLAEREAGTRRRAVRGAIILRLS